MSRIPRGQEHLKTGFTVAAASAARLRAYGARAERDGLANLARQWRELAAAKDALALVQLEAAGQVRGGAGDLEAALAEERYETEILYPKLLADSDAGTAEVFRDVIVAKKRHQARMEALSLALQGAGGDIEEAVRLF